MLVTCGDGWVRAGGVYRVGYQGGYTGWVIRDPVHPATLLEEGSPTQRSGPRRPCRAGVGGVGLDGRTGG